MLRFWRVFRILIIVAFVLSLPIIILLVLAALEGNFETYQMTQEQLAQEQFGFILMICVVVLIDGILALLLTFVGKRIKKIKALRNP